MRIKRKQRKVVKPVEEPSERMSERGGNLPEEGLSEMFFEDDERTDGEQAPEDDQDQDPEDDQTQAEHQDQDNPETIITPPSVEDIGEDDEADRRRYDDDARSDCQDEVFTQEDEVFTQSRGKVPTNKKIGAYKTNFSKFVKKLKAGQLSDIKWPLINTSEAVLVATIQMLEKQWLDLQVKVQAELTNTGLDREEVRGALWDLRQGQYGRMFVDTRAIFQLGITVRYEKNVDTAGNNEEVDEDQRGDNQDQRRPVTPLSSFRASSTSSEESRRSAASQRSRNRRERAAEEAANYDEGNQEEEKVGLSPEEAKRSKQWFEENKHFYSAPKGEEQKVENTQPQTSEKRDPLIPTEAEVKETVEQLKQAGQPQAAQQFEREETKRIRGMKTPPIQLYEVPELYVQNYEAYIWNCGEEMNWPEAFIERCIEMFRKERKFPGAIRLQGRLAEYQFPKPKAAQGTSQKKQTSSSQPDLSRMSPNLFPKGATKPTPHGVPYAEDVPHGVNNVTERKKNKPKGMENTGTIPKQQVTRSVDGAIAPQEQNKSKTEANKVAKSPTKNDPKKTKPEKKGQVDQKTGDQGSKKPGSSSDQAGGSRPVPNQSGQTQNQPKPTQQNVGNPVMDPFSYQQNQNASNLRNQQKIFRPADQTVMNLINQTSSPSTKRGTLNAGKYSPKTGEDMRRNSTAFPGSADATFSPDVSTPPRFDTSRPPPANEIFVTKSDFEDMVQTIISHLNQSQGQGLPSGSGNPSLNPTSQTFVPQPGTTGTSQFAHGQSQDAREQTRGGLGNPYRGGGGPGPNDPGGNRPPGGGGNPPYYPNNPGGGGGGGNPPHYPGGGGGGGGGDPHNPNDPSGGDDDPSGGPRRRQGNGNLDSNSQNTTGFYSRQRSVFQGTRGQGPIGNHSYGDPNGDPNDCTRLGWTNRIGPGNAKMPPQPMPKFDGTGCYEAFVNGFHIYVGNKQAPEADKFGYLLQCLSGQPKQMLGALCSVPYENGFLEEAFAILRKRYGGGNKLDRFIQQRLAKVPSIKKFDIDSLVTLSTIIDEIFYRVRNARPRDYDTYFEDQTWLVTQLMEKLPIWEQQGYIAEITRGPLREQNFLTFRDYIMWRYEQVNLLSPYVQSDDKPKEAAKPRAAHAYQQFNCEENESQMEGGSQRSDTGQSNQSFLENQHQIQSLEEEAYQASLTQYLTSTSQNYVNVNGASAPGQDNQARPVQQPVVPQPQGAVAGQPPARRQPSCSCCGGEHWIWTCRKFVDMKLGERYELVRTQGLCFHCLLKGHGIAACNFQKDKRCEIDGCKARHHRLVHRPRDSALCLIEEYCYYANMNPASAEELVEHICGISVYCGQNFNINDRTFNQPRELERYEHVSIKTITCDLITGTKRKRVVVAIDSGANNTNIDSRLAEEMGLPVIRKGLNRQMHLVTRSEKVVSDLVMFQLCPLGSEYGPNFVVGAFTVPGLIEGTPVPDWRFAAKKYTYLQPANPSAPHPDDKVSILLGTDYAHLMVGHESLRGEMGEPIAEKTPLGWAFQGRTAKEGQRERLGALIETHQSLYFPFQNLTTHQELYDPEEFETGPSDGGIRPPDEEELPPISWQLNHELNGVEEIEDGEIHYEEPSDPENSFQVDSGIPYLSDLVSLSSEQSDLSEISDDPLPESAEPWQEEVAVLRRSQSAPSLAVAESDRFQETRSSQESLVHARNYDWSESENTLLARQARGLDELDFESLMREEAARRGQREQEEVSKQDDELSETEGSDRGILSESPEKILAGHLGSEALIFDAETKDQSTAQEKSVQGILEGTENLEKDGQATFQEKIIDAIKVFPKSAGRMTIVSSSIALQANVDPEGDAESVYVTDGQKDLPLTDELPREMIATLREQIQEDTLFIGEHFLGSMQMFKMQEDLRSVLSDQEIESIFSSCCEDEIKQARERIEENQELERLIRQHWEMEAVGLAEVKPRTAANSEPTPEQWTPAQKAVDDRMKVVYLPEEKKFQMTIPWKAGDKPNFRCNRIQVKRRQEDTLNKLPPERLEKVRAIFQNYLEKDYVRKLEPHEIFDEETRYLPFFCVCDETKDTTPVRVVWDCRAIYHGRSLNSEIEDTPNRLQDLFRVLLRLRRYQYTITSDVSEMFLRVRLDPKDRPYHRFVFDGDDYIWNSILFGNVSSPNGSQKVLSSVCDLFGKDYPEAEETLRHSLYMDDASDSRPTEEKALATAQQLIGLLDKCTMPIHKFYSNSKLVIQNLDPKLLAKQITIGENSIDVETGKILGMCYNASPEEDYLSFTGKFKSIREWTNKASVTKVEKGKWTKRHVARAAASIYDPHGLISPFTVRSKIILQEIWKHKELDWDDILPEEICFNWEQWMEQVFVIPLIKIERWHHDEPKSTIQVHTFCDASEEGMCCATYIRVKKGRQVHVCLAAAKSRVSPLKAETISRLELAACVMGLRLSSAVQELYKVKPEEVFFWTDSMVALQWINKPAKAFKAFVANRIGEIQTHTEPRQWSHVPTQDNPADTGTRQISATELKDRELWWKGPDFLKKPQAEWPKRIIVEMVIDKELKQTVFLGPTDTEEFGKPTATSSPIKEQSPRKVELQTTGTKKVVPTRGMNLLCAERQSVGMCWDGLKKITRRMAYVIRFIRSVRKGVRLPTLELSNEEIQVATRRLIKMSQMESFNKELQLMEVLQKRTQKTDLNLCHQTKGSSILKFSPFLDEFGIIRSRSRLNKEEIYGFDKTYPVILDRHSGMAKLIAEQAHFEVGHPVGHNALKARISAKFVIVGLGTLVNSIKWKCVICQIRQNKPNQQLQAALPTARLGKKMRPFADTGIDYAGPFDIKMGRGKPRKKVWVLVLTCLSTRAVHFEATGGMETTNVLNAISRFADIRGTPETITSDNQTSFVKADKDLQAWLKTVDFEYIRRATLNFRGNQGIEWIFNPPHAPHFGGVFEIIVKAMKRALISTIGHEDLDEEEFRTVVSKATWILNSRPIQKVGDNSDFEALTPAHFLGGIPEEAVFPPNLPNIRSELQERLKHQIKIQEHLWERFQQEIIPQLVSRSKWLYQKENLKEGDLMVEVDEKTTRGHWKKVRVTLIFPSRDAYVRKVEIRDGEGRTYVRPITCLIPLKI